MMCSTHKAFVDVDAHDPFEIMLGSLQVINILFTTTVEVLEDLSAAGVLYLVKFSEEFLRVLESLLSELGLPEQMTHFNDTFFCCENFQS